MAEAAEHQLSEPPYPTLSKEPRRASSTSGLQGALTVRLKGVHTVFAFKGTRQRISSISDYSKGRHPRGKVPNLSSALEAGHRLETAGKLGGGRLTP